MYTKKLHSLHVQYHGCTTVELLPLSLAMDTETIYMCSMDELEAYSKRLSYWIAKKDIHMQLHCIHINVYIAIVTTTLPALIKIWMLRDWKLFFVVFGSMLDGLLQLAIVTNWLYVQAHRISNVLRTDRTNRLTPPHTCGELLLSVFVIMVDWEDAIGSDKASLNSNVQSIGYVDEQMNRHEIAPSW